MKELPLFDHTTPISCTIEDAQRPGRRELLEKMRAAINSVERSEEGIVLSYASDESATFEEFVCLEKQCCAFFGFDVGSDRLRWEAPPDATELMDSLYRFFSDPNFSVNRILV